MTSDEVVERISKSLLGGSITLPRAIRDAYLEGYDESWKDAQRMRAAEIKPKRARPSAKKGAAR